MATLKSLRINQGLSQTELANLSEVPQSTISRLEAGTTQVISPKAMKRVANTLGVKIADIDEFVPKLEGKEDPQPVVNGLRVA
jgi:transcriptional regulator with XRE-family HTH domain